jgi:MFS family permease
MTSRWTEIKQASALRHPGFRMLWTATLLSSTARWADLVVVGWLTLELTNSALMVGIVSGCKMAGYLFAPLMGVAADRLNRYKLLILASVVSGAIAMTMLGLLLTDHMAIGYLIVLSLVSSLTWALDHPTRQAFIPDLVGQKNLTNAVALNAVATETTVIIGPALGGLLIPSFGISGAYILIAVIYIFDLFALLRLKNAAPTQAITSNATTAESKVSSISPLTSLLDGFKYAWGNQAVFMLLLIAFMLNFFVAPYRYSFLPLLARYVLDTGPTGYGMLTSMAGVGALVAGLWVVSLGSYTRRGQLVILGGLLWPIAIFLLSLSSWFYLSLVIVFVAGIAQAISWTLIATLILSNTEAAMRGRIMGLRTGVVISLPFGNFLAGAIAENFGVAIAMAGYACCALLLMILIINRAPILRQLK